MGKSGKVAIVRVFHCDSTFLIELRLSIYHPSPWSPLNYEWCEYLQIITYFSRKNRKQKKIEEGLKGILGGVQGKK